MFQKNWQELIKPQKLKVETTADNTSRATIVAEPLERGFGLTLGNAVRRVLLSSLQGAAVTGLQIDGVLLLKEGVAEGMTAKEGGKTIIDFIRDAKDADVEMRVCSAALQLHDLTPDDLIEECDGVVGAAYMTEKGIEADLVLCY